MYYVRVEYITSVVQSQTTPDTRAAVSRIQNRKKREEQASHLGRDKHRGFERSGKSKTFTSRGAYKKDVVLAVCIQHTECKITHKALCKKLV